MILAFPARIEERGQGLFQVFDFVKLKEPLMMTLQDFVHILFFKRKVIKNGKKNLNVNSRMSASI